MNVSVECACGATLGMETATESGAHKLLTQWYEVHYDHRRTVEEFKVMQEAIHHRGTT